MPPRKPQKVKVTSTTKPSRKPQKGKVTSQAEAFVTKQKTPAVEYQVQADHGAQRPQKVVIAPFFEYEIEEEQDWCGSVGLENAKKFQKKK